MNASWQMSQENGKGTRGRCERGKEGRKER